MPDVGQLEETIERERRERGETDLKRELISRGTDASDAARLAKEARGKLSFPNGATPQVELEDGRTLEGDAGIRALATELRIREAPPAEPGDTYADRFQKRRDARSNPLRGAGR